MWLCSLQVTESYSSLLACAEPRGRRAAIIGTLHWAFALAGASAELAMAGRGKLEELIAHLQKDPRMLRLLYDMLADMLLECIRDNTLPDPVRPAALLATLPPAYAHPFPAWGFAGAPCCSGRASSLLERLPACWWARSEHHQCCPPRRHMQ